MPKKRKKYVPPLGGKLPNYPDAPTRTAVWHWFSDCFRVLDTFIPFASEPETLGWSDPHESIRNERGEKFSVEQEHAGAVRAAFEELLEKWEWPETPEEVCFLMSARLEWAGKLAERFGDMPGCDDISGILAPAAQARKVFIWMAFDLYDAWRGFPRKWWDGSSFEGYYGL